MSLKVQTCTLTPRWMQFPLWRVTLANIRSVSTYTLIVIESRQTFILPCGCQQNQTNMCRDCKGLTRFVKPFRICCDTTKYPQDIYEKEMSIWIKLSQYERYNPFL